MEVSGDLQAPAALPQITASVSTEYEARWAPQPVWRILKKKISCFSRDSNPGR